MKIICSSAGIIDIDRPVQGMVDICNVQFDGMGWDTSLCMDDIHNVKNIATFSACLTPMLNCVKQKGIDIPLAYAPVSNNRNKHRISAELLGELVEETIKTCSSVGCKYIIVESLSEGIDNSKLWEKNREFYLSLAEIARKYDVKILLKNQCKNVGGHFVRGNCSDAEEASSWIDLLNDEVGENRFGFCIDVGVCNLCGQDMFEYIRGLGKRIEAVVVRDCDGNNDSAMLPFTAVNEGTFRTDWISIIRGLRDINFDGLLIMSLYDTAIATSPMLRPALLQYAKAVAEYLKWQIEIEKLLRKYDSRVLFGAGNMCRNYMKCYGELYPPLFTCDNNSKFWDTEFCGLMIKSPEALKKLPEDTAIFICNRYYREIEQQLRDMGLKNPIEYFNDEYLSSFYYDRLVGEGRK